MGNKKRKGKSNNSSPEGPAGINMKNQKKLKNQKKKMIRPLKHQAILQ